MGETTSGVRHMHQQPGIGEHRFEFMDEPGAIEFGIGDENSSSCGDECCGIGGLMITRSTGQRDEDRREPDLCEFGDGGATGPTDEQIGSREDKIHTILIFDRPIEQTTIREIERALAHGSPVPAADDMMDGEVTSICPRRNRLTNREVDTTSAERAGDDGDEQSIGGYPEFPTGAGAIPMAIHAEHIGPNRVSGDHASGQVGPLERHRTHLGEATGQSVDSPSHCVLFGDDHGHPPEHRSNRTGHARIAADDEDHRRTTPTDQRDTGADSAQQTEHSTDVFQRQSPLDAAAGKCGEREAGVRDETGLDAASAADEVDGCWIMTGIDQCAGHRQPGQEMPGSASSGDECMGRGSACPAARHHFPLLATLNSTPTPAMVKMSDDPPADTNGSGTPVIGSAPTTAPMFTNA